MMYLHHIIKYTSLKTQDIGRKQDNIALML